jgi:transcriptional regulator with XRE-family HTH domain
MPEMKVSDQLRKAIKTSGISRYAISQATGIEQSGLSRFMAGKTLSLDVVDTLAKYFKLSLMPTKSSRVKDR